MKEDLRSPLLLASAEAVKDWDEEVISWLASEGGWGVRFFEELMVSGSWGVCRDGRRAGRDWSSGSGGSSSSGCHLGLPGKLGWMGLGRLASCWTLEGEGMASWMGKWERAGGLTRLRQLSKSPLWQQSKLWLGRRLPVLAAPVLRLSRISLNKSSSSPDPRKLLSRASSAHESWASSGPRVGVLHEDR